MQNGGGDTYSLPLFLFCRYGVDKILPVRYNITNVIYQQLFTEVPYAA